MVKKLFIVMLLLLAIITGGYSLVNGQEDSPDPVVIDTALNDMLYSFQLYSNFFTDTYPLQGLTVSRHGETYDQAVAYFSAGFSGDLAGNIVDTYTFWNPDEQKLQIIPTEGIPVLQEQDKDSINYYYLDSQNIIFERTFENYFLDGKTYLYRVFCQKEDMHWKVCHLEWEPVMIH